jgi:hypothetical protein
MRDPDLQRRLESLRDAANDEMLRSGAFVVALFAVTVVVNGLLAIAFIGVLDALGGWGDARLRTGPEL